MTQTKRVVILTTDTDSDSISDSPIAERSTKKSKKKRMPKAQQSLALKISKQGASLKDLKSKSSVALDLAGTLLFENFLRASNGTGKGCQRPSRKFAEKTSLQAFRPEITKDGEKKVYIFFQHYTKNLPSLFGKPSISSEFLEIHPSDDDVEDFQMSCELPATQLSGVVNSPPSAS
ncbi:hypothetical protein AVEN_197447-1 [Araneus ventricosus]|uniref:Uncharacterized protein n=1 Tax=Araneus ventricosus TaxID=182803 RepID=A0A4Y2ICS0_ARAVE|nr:hypothetical protein AVEN_197447-1 [Araneus ventricosus]